MLWQWFQRIAMLRWPALEQFASPLSQVVLAPLLLHRLGPVLFGVWMLVLSILFWSPVLSLGRSTVLMALMPALATDRSALSRETWRAFRLVVLLGGLLIGVSVAIASRLPLALADAASWTVVAGLAAALLMVCELDNLAAAMLKGWGDFRAAAYLEVAGRIFHACGYAALLLGEVSLVRWLLITLCCLSLKCVAKWACCLQRISAIAPACAVQTKSAEAAAADLSKLGLWGSLQVLSGVAFYSMDRWIVGYALGPAALGAYALCNQYVQFAHSLTAASSQALVPWAGRQYDSEKLMSRPHRVSKLLLVGSVLACVPVGLAWALSGPALSLWISPEFAAHNSHLVDGLTLVFLLLAANVVSFSILVGLRQSRFIAMLTMFAAAVFVLLVGVSNPAGVMDVIVLKGAYALVGLIGIVRLLQLTRQARQAERIGA